MQTTTTSAVYKNPQAPVEDRVNDLVGRMTLEEKIDLSCGNDMESRPNARLGIPTINFTDGPLGVRWETATAFPSAICSASSFDPGLMTQLSAAMGVETLARGRDCLLAPCVNLTRAPQGGRNFESFGEDPHLAATLATAYITGLQGQGVLAMIKHFALNEQEHERMTIDVRASERTKHEMHFPAFLAGVNAGVWSVMCSYNRVDGHYAAENQNLLTDTLKNLWGFKGFVASDWGATHSCTPSANAGLDMEMPYPDNFGKGKLLAAVKAGEVSEATIDDKARRILRAMFAMGIFDKQTRKRPSADVITNGTHAKVALHAAEKGIVLLKNNGVLPLGGKQTLAIIGPNAALARNNGGGSSRITPPYSVSPLQGFEDLVKNGRKNMTLKYAVGVHSTVGLGPFEDELFVTTWKGKEVRGVVGEYFDNQELNGQPVLERLDRNISFNWGSGSPDAKVPADKFSVRWSGWLKPRQSGVYDIATSSDDGVRLYFEDRLVIDDWNDHALKTNSTQVKLEAGNKYKFKLEFFDSMGSAEVHFGRLPTPEQRNGDLAAATKLASESDVAIVFAGCSEEIEGEGVDRLTLALPAGQDELITAVAKANPNTVVVLNGGGSMLMPWVDQVAAVVQAWYPGQEGGNAVANLLSGAVNFEAKMPVSFYRKESDASSYGNYPGADGKLDYAEGVFIGYRHLDKKNIEPLFPFGHGLSYTTFKLDQPSVAVTNPAASTPEVKVTVRVSNTGARAGAEVVQLYVQEKTPKVDRPIRELKGYKKVHLEPNASETITFKLDKNAFAYYDETTHAWTVNPGAFELSIGTSSRDLPIKEGLTLQ